MTRHRTSRPLRLLTFGGTAFLAVLAALTLVPPYTMLLLAARVVTTELSPLVALLALVWLLLSVAILRGDRQRLVLTGAVLLAAAAVSLRPLALYGSSADRGFEQVGGPRATLSPVAMLRGEPDADDIVEREIAYRAADGSPLAMRLFRAAVPGRRPTVVAIYGGAWRSGSASQGAGLNRELAARGFTVVAIDYRHAPRFQHPAQLDDVRGSLALLRDSSAAWGIDTSRIALLGRSAGGHLAELAAFTADSGAVRAVVAIYAPFDLVRGYVELPRPDPVDARAVLRAFLGGTPAQVPARYRDASPSALVRPGLPPVLLIFGGADHLVRPAFNRAAAAAFRAAGGRVAEVELPWAEHGFDMVPGGLGAQLATEVIVRFLEGRALR